MTTTHKDVFAAAEAEILKHEGAKARGAFRNHLGCLAPEALEKIDDVDEETFRDAKSIIELLKENLSLWKEEEGDNAVEDL